MTMREEFKMGDGYNFQQLKSAILPLSEAKNWERAKKEWKLSGITESETPETCPCGHYPIIDLCEITNILNKNTIEVGNVCVKRFLGFRSDLIFAAIKRIRKESEKSINADAAVFFYERGIINSWEYQFTQSTMLKRDLSHAQKNTRNMINKKVLASIKRRGIG